MGIEGKAEREQPRAANAAAETSTPQGAAPSAQQQSAAPAPSEDQPRVLVVDDDPAVLMAVGRTLARGGCKVTQIEVKQLADVERVQELLVSGDIDVAVLDVMLPHTTGIALLREAKERRPEVSIVMMTASSSVETAVDAVKGGAFDYLTKPFDSLEKVVLTVRRAWEHARLIQRNNRLERMLEAKEGFEDLVGQSPKMRAAFQLIDAVSASPMSVLVRGESGTGKELVARAVHRRSPRKDGPFLTVNCASLTETLLESELFGHVKGAFTGATTNRKGLFEAADGGTLFLDEIGDISPKMQTALLRALQEGEIKPLGSNGTVHVDVRVIAATNADLERAMKARTFREDLYYRLNVVTVELPPLRSRPEDIALLAAYFLKKACDKMGKKVRGLADSTLRALQTHDWPGNVRELENAIQRGVVLCPVQGDILPEHLPPGIGGSVPSADVEAASLSHLPYAQAKKAALSAFEKSYLGAKLKASHGNISQAARDAGLDRSNFKRLLRDYGVLDPSNEGDPE